MAHPTNGSLGPTSQVVRALPGVIDEEMKGTDSQQHVESEERITFASKMIKGLSALRSDPVYLEQTRSADTGQQLQVRLATDPPKLFPDYEVRRLTDFFKAWVTERELGNEGLDIDNQHASNLGDVVPPMDFAWTDGYLCDPSVPALESIKPLQDVNGYKLTDELSFNRGCDCEDDECDPRTCACLRRAAQAYPYSESHYQKMFAPPALQGTTDGAESRAHGPNFVYDDKGRIDMLNVPLGTPIFECNQHCACSSSCRNRVVQKGKSAPLAFWKTECKGWGIKAIGPLAMGTFVGAYGGELLNDAESERRAIIYETKLGTTYLQDIDSHNIKVHLTRQIIERELAETNQLARYRGSAENERRLVQLVTRAADLIEHFEEYLKFIELDDESISIGLWAVEKRRRDGAPEPHADQVARVYDKAKAIAQVRAREAAVRQRCALAKSSAFLVFAADIDPDTEYDDPVWNFLNLGPAEQERARQLQQIRSDLEDVHCLTVDSALWGNHTRFFNHSCDPNIFHVPVYTDSPSIMRPLLAFFTLRDVKAGEELCFNYKGNWGSDDFDDAVDSTGGAQQSPLKASGRARIVAPSTKPGPDTAAAISATPADSGAPTNRPARLSIVCSCGAKNCTGRVFE